MATPAPVKQRVLTFLTPRIADILVQETKPGYTKEHPEYGTAHPDSTRYPDHKLAYIEQKTEQGEHFTYHYLAARESQDEYNWQLTQADLGGTKFDAVQRTYVTLRSGFTESSASVGSTMPDTPSGKFSGTYVLAEARQVNSDDPKINSLFVIEDRLYVKKVAITQVKYDAKTGRSDSDTVNWYYRGESVGGTTIQNLVADPTNSFWGLQSDGTFRELDQQSDNWFTVVERSVLPAGPINSASNPAKARVVERTTPLGTDLMYVEVGAMPTSVPSYGDAHYQFSGHKLVYIEPADESGKLFRFYYVAKRPDQDQYNWEWTDADIGGTKFKAVKRTYVTLRSEFSSSGVAMGDSMPNVPVGKFSGTFILALRRQVRTNDPKIDNLFVIDEHTYIKRVVIKEMGVDSLNGRSLYSRTSYHYASETVGGKAMAALASDPENAYWGLQSNGTQRSCKQISEEWYEVETQDVIGGTVSGGKVLVHGYYTNDNYYWPPVLSGIEFMKWAKNGGGEFVAPRLVFSPDGYNGPCRTRIVREWKVTPFEIEKVDQMLPEPIYYSCPYYALNAKPSLHNAVECVCDIGTGDDEFEQTSGSKRTFEATNYTEWPDSIVAYDDQEPFRGGYLRTTKTVFSPA